MKNILVPTDFSEIAMNGLKAAIAVAKKMNAKIFLANFVRTPDPAGFSVTADTSIQDTQALEVYTVELIKQNKKRLSMLSEQCSTDNVPIEGQIVDDDWKHGIKDFVEKNNIQMIIMGTTGEHSFPEYFTGNHTEQVIENVSCPVIAIKEWNSVEHFDKMVVGIDLFEDYKERSFQYIQDLADLFDATIQFVYVNEHRKEKEFIVQQVEGFKRKHSFKNYSINILKSEDPENAILSFTRKMRAGLIISLTDAKSGVFRAITHHFSEDLIQDSELPVMTIHQ